MNRAGNRAMSFNASETRWLSLRSQADSLSPLLAELAEFKFGITHSVSHFALHKISQ